jgi:hypothetical protein
MRCEDDEGDIVSSGSMASHYLKGDKIGSLRVAMRVSLFCGTRGRWSRSEWVVQYKGDS